jgi:hypothetical protein
MCMLKVGLSWTCRRKSYCSSWAEHAEDGNHGWVKLGMLKVGLSWASRWRSSSSSSSWVEHAEGGAHGWTELSMLKDEISWACKRGSSCFSWSFKCILSWFLVSVFQSTRIYHSKFKKDKFHCHILYVHYRNISYKSINCFLQGI